MGACSFLDRQRMLPKSTMRVPGKIMGQAKGLTRGGVTLFVVLISGTIHQVPLHKLPKVAHLEVKLYLNRVINCRLWSAKFTRASG